MAGGIIADEIRVESGMKYEFQKNKKRGVRKQESGSRSQEAGDRK
jgi:hypothetical protein